MSAQQLTTFLVLAAACMASALPNGGRGGGRGGGMGGGTVCSCTDTTSTYGQCLTSANPFVFMTAPTFAPNTTCEDNCFQMYAPGCLQPLAAIRQQKQACMAQIGTFRGCSSSVSPVVASSTKPNFPAALHTCMRQCGGRGGRPFNNGGGGGVMQANTIHTCARQARCRHPMPDCMSALMSAKNTALSQCLPSSG